MRSRAADYVSRALASGAARWPSLLGLLPHLPAGLRRRLADDLEGASLPEVQVERGPLRFVLDLADHVDRGIFLGVYDPEELALQRRLVEPGVTCIDVGANSGLYACHMGHLSGPSGRVHAFEPEPRSWDRLARNVELNGLADRVVMHRKAVGDTDGTVTFFRHDAQHSGWGSLHRHPKHEGELSVEAIRLDTWMKEIGPEEIHLLKIDVEGSELEVLRGATESLGAGRFRYILTEYNGFWYERLNRSPEAFFDLFESAGYEPAPWSADRYRALRRGAIPASTVLNLLFQRGPGA